MPVQQAHKVLAYKIADQSLSGLTTLTIPIGAGFKHVRAVVQSHWNGGLSSDLISLRLSTGGSVDSGANYDSSLMIVNPSGTPGPSNSPGVTSVTVGRGVVSAADQYMFTTTRIELFRPDLGTFKNIEGISQSPDTGIVHIFRGFWKNTGVVDGLNLVALTGNPWNAGSSVRVYGEK